MHKVARKIQNLSLKFRKPIFGSNNRILNNGILKNVKYDIVGDNNRIEISEGAFLSNLLIWIAIIILMKVVRFQKKII